jgi:hypothetical protein
MKTGTYDGSLRDQGTVLWQHYLELEHRGVRERSL